MTASDARAGARSPYRTLVVGTDGSPSATRAVREAALLAQAFRASLVIVAVFGVPAGPPPATPDIDDLDERPQEVHAVLVDADEAEARARSGQAVAEAVGLLDVTCRVEPGDPAEALVRVATELGADLIVVGSRGMTKADRFFLGSVPNAVSHHAPCDLVIARTSV